MAKRAIGAGVGVVFGVTLSWTGLSSPEVLRQGLLFQNAYLFEFFGAAVAVAFTGLRILRARRVRAVLTGEPVSWTPVAPQRRHIVGSVIFGTGWAIADACPGPIATQVGQGVLWSLFTLAGVLGGILLYLRREEPVGSAEPDSAPPARLAAPASSAPAPVRG